MLKGEKLGAAIRQALTDNGKRPADAAAYFSVKAPSVNGWLKTGRISKENFNRLVKWLDKTPVEFWGIDGYVGAAAAGEEQLALATRHIAPAVTLQSHLDAICDALAALPNEHRAIAGTLLATLAEKPESATAVGISLEGLINAANAGAATGRQPKFINSA
jgi:hypothetical protein